MEILLLPTRPFDSGEPNVQRGYLHLLAADLSPPVPKRLLFLAHFFVLNGFSLSFTDEDLVIRCGILSERPAEADPR